MRSPLILGSRGGPPALLGGGIGSRPPATPPAGRPLGPPPARGAARDALTSRHGQKLSALPAGARVGTSSLRRGLQLRRLRPDLTVEPLRGKLGPRLRKLDAGRYTALVGAQPR